MVTTVRTIVVTGPIGGGKSYVSRLMEERGIPVFDCDKAAKEIYRRRPDLASMATVDIFSDPARLKMLEDGLFPVLLEDFHIWAESSGKAVVAFESATILEKDFFRSFGDWVLLVDAPELIRLKRALGRGGISEESIRQRMALQPDHSTDPRVSFIIDNSSSGDRTLEQLDKFLKSINYGNTKN